MAVGVSGIGVTTSEHDEAESKVFFLRARSLVKTMTLRTLSLYPWRWLLCVQGWCSRGG